MGFTGTTISTTTISTASDSSEHPEVVCDERGDVRSVNCAWTLLCGFSQEEIAGRNLRILQGPDTCRATIRTLMRAVGQKQQTAVRLTNYNQHGEPFQHTLHIFPLTGADPSESPLFRAVSHDVVQFPAMVPRQVPIGGMIVLTTARPPYHIAWASDAWLNLCCFSSEEIVGRQSLSIIQGGRTDPWAVSRLMDAVKSEQPTAQPVTLVNYDKHGLPFRHSVSIEPVTAADEGRHVETPLRMCSCPVS